MLKKNDEIELLTDNYGYEGEGVGRAEGMPVFVPFAARGDRVLVRIVKVTSSHAFGKIIRIITPSKERVQGVEDICPVYGKCGGCSLMHVSYDKQLELKRERVADCMRKIGRLDVEVLSVVPSEKQLHYRNKIQLPIGEIDGKPVAGFYAPRSHRIVKAENCLLQEECMEKVTKEFLLWMEKESISSYNEESGKGLVRHLFIRCGEAQGIKQIAVMPVINGKNLPAADSLCKRMKTVGVTTLCLNINTKKDNVILGDEMKVLFGDGFISDTLCGNVFEISPMSFYQVNRTQAEKLYGIALEKANISKDDVVYDLYCGAGTITLAAAKYAKQVYGIEIVPEAVENAKRNAERNGITNASFLCGDVVKTVSRIKTENPPTAVILDPPRKGCDRKLLDFLSELAPPKIVYVSCNPATLARDMAYLAENGYTPGSVQPVDMFPQTAHVETVVLMSRMNK